MSEAEKNKKEKPPKPKYGVPACVAFMVKLAMEHEPLIIFGGLFTTFLAVTENLVNLFISPLVLRSVEQKAPVGQLILTIVLMIGLLMLCRCLTNYVSEIDIYRRITLRSVVIALINGKAATTSYCNVENEDFKKICDKAHACTGNNSAAAEAVWNTLFNLIKNIAGFIIYILLLTNVQPMLLLLILATTIPGYFINRYINGWGYRHKDELREIDRSLNCVTKCAGDIQSAKDIRIFGLRPWFDSMYRSAMRAKEAFHMRGARVYIWSNIVSLILTFLHNAVAYWYLIGMALEGGLTASEFLLYFSAVGGFSGWISGILGGFNELHTKCLDLSYLLECLNFKEVFRFGDGKAVPCEDGRPAEIRLENVSFRYPGAEKDTLKNINLTLRAGEHLAVVGLNGAGKTTLIKLISGFYDPTEGRVTWNGTDIREFNRREYYKLFSAVFQDMTMIPGSLTVNVAASETDIDMDKVRRCVEKADLTKKFESLPSGFDTNLNREVYEDAVELSGGERQRLMLARALYKDAPVLILDEPTAALDPIAESEIYQKYNDMTAGKSAVYISHRLASTRFCDRIILIENNTIAEEGTHEELLAKNGRYAELFEIQSRYYRDNYKPEEVMA